MIAARITTILIAQLRSIAPGIPRSKFLTQIEWNAHVATFSLKIGC